LRAEQIIKLGERQARWDGWINAIYTFTLTRARAISWGTVVVLAICAWGISQITTNYSIIRNLPRNRQITEDFKFFERELSGFRPLELAVFIQPGYEASDYAVVREMDKIEGFLRQHSFLQAISSQTLPYKSINQMFANNRPDA
jgi:predicted RND superfamily exporter protein